MGKWQSHEPEMTQNQVDVFPRHLGEHNDEFLLHMLGTGASWAMEPLYHRYSGLLYALAYRMVCDHQVAEDIVQETFLAIWQHAISYSPQEGPVRSWLVSLLRHRTIDYLRRVRSRSCWQDIPWEDLEKEEGAALPDVWEEVLSSLQQAQVREALLQLPTEQRLVIILAYFQGWTHAEIAQCCQLPFGTVKARIRLGLRHLKQVLEPWKVGEISPTGNAKKEEMRPQSGTIVIIQAESDCPAGYELYQDGACGCFRYTEWQPLLEQIDAFEFRGTSGSFTARKEKRLHSRTYWYAFRWGSMGRQKMYLGRSSELRLAHLEAIARKLYGRKLSD